MIRRILIKIKGYSRVAIHEFTLLFIFLKERFFKNNRMDNDKILLVGHDLVKAGAQTLLYNIAKEMKLKNIEVVIIVKKYGPMLSMYDSVFPTYVAKSHSKFEKLVTKLNRKGYKKAICNTVVTGDLVPYLKKQNYKVVSLVHELPMLIIEKQLEKNSNNIARLSDVNIFASMFVYNKFNELAQVKTKYEIRPQGLYLNVGHIANNVTAKRYICSNHKIPMENKIVLNVATGIKIKGFDWFLEIAIKSQNIENLSFIWVGDYQNEIYQNILNKYNIKSINNLHLPGYINKPELLVEYYDAADVLLLTSRAEPFASIVLEAFNSLTPVIAFENCGGSVDAIVNNETGMLAKYGDINDMQNLLIETIFDDKKIEELGNNAKKSLIKYDFKEYVSYLINVVENI